MISLSQYGLSAGWRWIPTIVGVTLFALGLLVFLQIERLPLQWAGIALTGGGVASATLGNLRRSLFPFIAQISLILALYSALSGRAGEVLDSSVSARYAFRSVGSIWNNYTPDSTASYKLRRSFRYSLNFYFHRELPDWSARPAGTATWIFTSIGEAGQLRELGLDCRFSSPSRAVIVCEGSGSVQPAPDSR